MNASGIPYIYWVAWWIIAMVAYIGLFQWWKKEIKIVDKKNLEKLNIIQQQKKAASNTKMME